MSEVKVRGIGGQYQGAEIPFEGDLLIGRDPAKCQLVVSNDTSVSGLHCKIQTLGNDVYLTDLGSSNGTFLSDGTRLDPQKPVRLSNGKSFRLGSGVTEFQITGGAERTVGILKPDSRTESSPSEGTYSANRILELFRKPVDAGKEFVQGVDIKISVVIVLLHAVCSGFFCMLVTSRIYEAIIEELSEVLQDTLGGLLSMIPGVGSVISAGSDYLDVGGKIGSTLGDYLTPSNGAVFGVGFFSALIISGCFIALLAAVGYLLHENQLDAKKALNVAALRSVWNIPASLIAMLIVLASPLYGVIFFFAFQFFGILMSYSAAKDRLEKEKQNGFAIAYAVILVILVIVLLLEAKGFGGNFVSDEISNLMF